MNTQAATEKKPLTAADPVDTKTLEELRTLQEARQRFADNLLTLEQEKIKLLAGAKKVDDQITRVFQGCLVERGLPPETEMEIDARTGKIKLFGDEDEEEKAPPATS